MGGRIEGTGTVRLWEKRASKPLKSPVVDMKVDLRDIDLGVLAGSEDLVGRLTLHADATGPLDALAAHVTIPAGTPVKLLGDDYALGPVEIALETDKGDKADRKKRGKPEQTATIKTLQLKRKAGGAVDIHGKVALAHQDLDLDVVLDRLPLAGLPGVATSDVPVSGFASAKLHVGGRPESPELTGDIDLAQVMVRGVKLGTRAPRAVADARRPGTTARRRHPWPSVRPLRRRRPGGAGTEGRRTRTPRSTSARWRSRRSRPSWSRSATRAASSAGGSRSTSIRRARCRWMC